MTLEIGILFGILVMMAVFFFTELLPIELTAFLGLVVLTLGGYVEPAEAFTGFASPAVITMLSIFFVSGALLHTGVADMVGARVHKVIGNREVLLVVAIMLVAGILSAFMNNVAAVAVLLPAVASIAHKTGIAPSRLFMPLSFGAILGGTMTLVGTPPNILAADLLRERNLAPFELFDFTPVGVVLMGVGILYMVTIGRWLLPKHSIADRKGSSEDLTNVYHLDESMFSIRVPKGSSLDGWTLGETRLGSALNVQVVGIVRNGEKRLAPGADTVLQEDDVLLIEGHHSHVEELLKVQGVEIGTLDPGLLADAWGKIGCVGIRLLDDSAFVGKNLRDVHFREKFGAVVVGIRRDSRLIDTDLAVLELEAGDELLALGTRRQLAAMSQLDDVELSQLDPTQLTDLDHHLFLLRVHAASPLVGALVRESRMRELVGLTVVGINRDGETMLAVGPKERIRAGDQLLVTGDPEKVRTLVALGDVQLQEDVTRASIVSDDVGIEEVTLAPRSRVAGKTLAQIDFREKHGLQVLAIWRKGRPIREDLAGQRLRTGDAFLVQGSRKKIRLLGSNPDFVVLSPGAQEVRRTKKAPFAVGALLVMIAMVVSGYMPIHVAAFTAATLVVLLGTITMEEAYRSVEWKAIFLVAAILPVGLALERTGAASMISQGVTSMAGPLGEHAVMAGMVTLSSILSQCLDGAPAVVLMAPVVFESAETLDMSPHAIMMGVSLAASAAFMTPFSHKANLLVMGSGGYKVIDYLRVGTPLTLVLLALMVFLVPLLFTTG